MEQAVFLRTTERLSADPINKLSQMWEGWCSTYVEAGNPLMRHGAKEHIEFTRVELPILPEGLKFHTNTLAPSQDDRRAHSTVYNSAMTVADDHKRFVLPFVESDWYDLVRGMSSALDVHEQ